MCAQNIYHILYVWNVDARKALVILQKRIQAKVWRDLT